MAMGEQVERTFDSFDLLCHDQYGCRAKKKRYSFHSNFLESFKSCIHLALLNHSLGIPLGLYLVC